MMGNGLLRIDLWYNGYRITGKKMDNQKAYKQGYEDGVLAFIIISYLTANHWHANKKQMIFVT